MNESGQRWEDRDCDGEPGHYCNAHDYAFPRGEICQLCCADPGPPIAVTQTGLDDRQSVEVERELRTVSKEVLRIARELAKGTDRELAMSAKFYDTYLKSARAWREIHGERLQVESDERLIEHDRRMAGLRGSN